MRAGETSGSGPLELKPKTSPLGKLIAAIVICLFWNGIVGLFTYFEVNGLRRRLGMELVHGRVSADLPDCRSRDSSSYVPYQMLALANPRPTITLSRAVRAGRRDAHDRMATERGGAPGPDRSA